MDSSSSRDIGKATVADLNTTIAGTGTLTGIVIDSVKAGTTSIGKTVTSRRTRTAAYNII
jgi:hypothetical protein